MVPIEATEVKLYMYLYQYMHHTGAIKRTKANGVFIDKLYCIAVHSKLLLLQ